MIQKNYIDTSTCSEEEFEHLKEIYEDSDCNNGYAMTYRVLGNVEEAAYPKAEAYFQSLGLKEGDEVIVHFNW